MRRRIRKLRRRSLLLAAVAAGGLAATGSVTAHALNAEAPECLADLEAL